MKQHRQRQTAHRSGYERKAEECEEESHFNDLWNGEKWNRKPGKHKQNANERILANVKAKVNADYRNPQI